MEIIWPFNVEHVDIFEKYFLPTITKDVNKLVSWQYKPMQFWQNQLNFATWCATTGCGVSYENHIVSKYSSLCVALSPYNEEDC